jgi:hypothetical protein
LESRLLKGRKIMIFGQVTDKLARDVVARIQFVAKHYLLTRSQGTSRQGMAEHN